MDIAIYAACSSTIWAEFDKDSHAAGTALALETLAVVVLNVSHLTYTNPYPDNLLLRLWRQVNIFRLLRLWKTSHHDRICRVA